MGHYIFTLALPDATGASRTACSFAAAFLRNGHDVSLVHGNLPKEEASIVPEMQKLGVETILEAGLSCPASPFLLGRLARTFCERRPLGIIAFQQRDRAIALQAAERIGVPSFVHAANTHTFHGFWPWRTAKEIYYRRVLRRCPRLIVCVSPLVQKQIHERFRVDRQRTAVLLNGIDVSRHKPLDPERRNALRQSLGVQEHETMLINVGRISDQKGQDILLNAFARLKPQQRNIKLVLVGGVSHDSKHAKSLKMQAGLHQFVRLQGLSDNVVLAGWRTDVPALLAASEGYVHSARWDGGFALAAMEAMAAERPCISTDCQGRPTGFVEGMHGWIVPKENPEELARAMGYMIECSREQLAEMGRACRRLMEERYDILPVAAKFAELIHTQAQTGRDLSRPRRGPI